MSPSDRHQVDALSMEAAFTELREQVLGVRSLSETMQQVAELARRVVPMATEVSITLVENDRPRTAAFTGPLAVPLDERQYETGFGPCLGAAATGQTIRTDTADPDGLYPAFAQAARRNGIRHTLSVPLPIPGRVVGAMNLYGAGEKPFDEEAEVDVSSLAGYVAILLANAAMYTDAVDLADQLRLAMASRAVIEQAKGIVMAQNGGDPDEAFTTLARLSQTRNVKLRDLAEDVVRRTTARGHPPAS